MSTLQQKALEIAQGEIGKSEIPKGSNWGPDVQKYLASVGIDVAAPWCMAFVYWCYVRASSSMGVINPLLKTGGVLSQWTTRQRFSVASAPQPGDIFIMDFGKGEGHTGIVERVDHDYVYTIDGNTNQDGSREGYEVERKTRSRARIKGYLRFV
jgi:hypothetical protein